MIRRGLALFPVAVILLALAPSLALAAGPSGQALVVIAPCRALDTRNVAGPLGGPALAANEIRILTVVGACGVPSNALGLAVNITAVQPASNGFARLYAGNAATPPTSVLSFNAGVTRASNAMVALASDLSGTVALENASPGAAHYIIDVAGYWVPACTSTITVTNPATSSGAINVPFSQTFTAAGGTGALTFTTVSPLPAGLTLAANGTLAGTPTHHGTFPITVTATDANGCTGAGQTYTLVIVCQTITVTNPATTTGAVNVPFSQTFTQTGGQGTTTFSTSDPLPIGLNLAPGGVLSGTPVQSGAFNITAVATDADGCTGAGATYPLVINCPAVSVSITPTPPQVCSASAGNGASATAGFSSYSWSITNGTIQGSTTGASISYTAGASGNVGLTVNVTDAAACPGQATLNVPITANPAPPVIAAANPQSFTVSGAAGTFTLTFAGQTTAPLAFNATAAAVQAALNGLPSVGGVGGTAAVTQAANVYTVAFGGTLAGPQPLLAAAGAGGCTVAVDPPAVCAVSTGNLAVGPAGATAWAWTITNGTITSATNVQTITYTAGSSGTVTLGLTVTNPGGCTALNSLDVTINAVPATPTITPTPSPVCGNSTGNTADGPAGATSYAWSITNGTITSATNIQTITYTAGPSGNAGLTLTVTNASGCSAQGSLNVPINAAPATPTITPTPASVCANSTGNGASGPAGATSYAWSITNGTITSLATIQSITYTAGASGSVGLTLVVTNASGCSTSNTQSVPINPTPAFTPAAGTLATATFNTAYALTFTGTVGTAPFTFALASGALPTGMTLNASGTVSPNVPTATGAFTFTIMVTDSKGCSSSQAYTLAVQPKLTAKAYTDVGNTQLAGGVVAPATPSVGVVAVSSGDTSDTTITYAVTVAPTHGALTTFNTNGTFLYTPNVGNTAADSFTYTGTSNGVAATQTATIAFNGMVWYVDNASASLTNDGRSNTPLKTMTAVGGAATANGDFIYVAQGSGFTTGAYAMKPGQQLIGAGATLNVPTVGTILSIAGNPSNTPTLSGTLTLANSVTTNGIDMSTGSSTAITGTSVSGVSVTARSVSTTTGTTVLLSSAGGAFSFTSLSANGAATGLSLTSTSGTFTVTGDGTGRANGSGGSISNAATEAVHMLAATGTVTLKSMNLSLNTSAVDGMLVDNNAGGTLTVNVIGCAYTGVTGSVSQNKSLLQFEGGGTANVTANVQNSFFNGSRTYGFFATAAGTSIMNVTLNQSGFGTDVNTGTAVNNPGTAITNPPAFAVGITNGGGAQVDYVVSGNTFWGADGLLGAIYAVTISGATTTGGSHLNGSFTNNRIGKTLVAGSGCANGCAGLGLLPGTSGQFKATVTNNDIRQVNSLGMQVFNSAGAGATIAVTAKIKGNTFDEPDTTGSPLFQRAIVVSPGNSGGASEPTCAEIGGTLPGEPNVINGAWQAANFIRVTNTNNTQPIVLPGLTPASGATAAQVNAFVQANNTMAAGSVNATLGTAGINGGSPCP